MDNDGYISNGELFQVLKMMVGNNLKDTQLQQIVDKTIFMYDKVGWEIRSSFLHTIQLNVNQMLHEISFIENPLYDKVSLKSINDKVGPEQKLDLNI